MITKIQGEHPFQVLTNNFSISPSNEGYTLQISADGKQYSNLFSVGAGVTRLVTGVAANSYYRLLGNQSQVSINWMKTCVTEGGSGGSGTELRPVEAFPDGAQDGTVVAYNGSSSAIGVYQFDGTDWVPVGVDDLSAYWTSAQTQEYADSADTIIYASAATYADDAIAEALTAYTPTSGFSTINGSAITDGSAIVIEAGDVAPLSAAVETLSAATVGKADAANVTPNTGMYFPRWNSQGIITGDTGDRFRYGWIQLNNGRSQTIPMTQETTLVIYTPTAAGSAGDILVSTGGTPVWSAATFAQQSDLNTLSAATESAIATIPENPVQSLSVDTIWKGTQAQYDALAPDYDPNTFYIIVSN